jgi:hypothetical protein
MPKTDNPTPAALEALATDLGTFLAGSQALMSMFGKPGTAIWEAWGRVRDALGLHGYHTAEEASAALLAAARRGGEDTEAEELSEAFADGRLWSADAGQWRCSYDVGTVSRLAEGATPLEALRAARSAAQPEVTE